MFLDNSLNRVTKQTISGRHENDRTLQCQKLIAKGISNNRSAPQTIRCQVGVLESDVEDDVVGDDDVGEEVDSTCVEGG